MDSQECRISVDSSNSDSLYSTKTRIGLKHCLWLMVLLGLFFGMWVNGQKTPLVFPIGDVAISPGDNLMLVSWDDHRDGGVGNTDHYDIYRRIGNQDRWDLFHHHSIVTPQMIKGYSDGFSGNVQFLEPMSLMFWKIPDVPARSISAKIWNFDRQNWEIDQLGTRVLDDLSRASQLNSRQFINLRNDQSNNWVTVEDQIKLNKNPNFEPDSKTYWQWTSLGKIAIFQSFESIDPKNVVTKIHVTHLDSRKHEAIVVADSPKTVERRVVVYPGRILINCKQNPDKPGTYIFDESQFTIFNLIPQSIGQIPMGPDYQICDMPVVSFDGKLIAVRTKLNEVDIYSLRNLRLVQSIDMGRLDFEINSFTRRSETLFLNTHRGLECWSVADGKLQQVIGPSRWRWLVWCMPFVIWIGIWRSELILAPGRLKRYSNFRTLRQFFWLGAILVGCHVFWSPMCSELAKLGIVEPSILPPSTTKIVALLVVVVAILRSATISRQFLTTKEAATQVGKNSESIRE